jgi:hypothetical protein
MVNSKVLDISISTDFGELRGDLVRSSYSEIVTAKAVAEVDYDMIFYQRRR